MTILWLDYESRSRCDLRSRGVYNYSRDASTQILCLSYAFDDEDVQTWLPSQPFPQRVANYFKNGGQIRAHNASFDRLITEYVLCSDFNVPAPPLASWYCTAAQARANCAPGSLEDAGRFAGASMKKDHRGSQLIRLLSIPQANGEFRQDATLMAEMVAYCEQDVRAMRAISQAMRPLSDDELTDYHVNERINDRGVLVDVPLCAAAMRFAAAETEEIQQIVAEVTEGAITSVRSPKMREWVLERVGEQAKKLMWTGEKYSIDKTVRANLLAMDDPEEIPPHVADVIQCADDLWASSVAKFSRLEQLADEEDHRVRGAFVFAGGAATGRASSYGAQVHNFTRKCAKQPDDVRQAMVRGHSITPQFGKRITDVLKSMLRPALIAKPGHVLIAYDWSAIEGRVHPWLSNCPAGEAKLDVFRSGLDPYIVNAVATYRQSYEHIAAEHEAGRSDMRQVGKVQELACFSQETQVLTHNGVKAILDVRLTDQLWDGEQWVNHQGVIRKGQRQTINVCGMEVTPEHLVKTPQTWVQAQQLVLNKQLLTQALATGSANLPFWVLSASNKALRMPDMPVCSRLTDGISLAWTWIASTLIKAMSRVIFDLSPAAKIATTTNGQCKICSDTSQNLKPVFDILNSGPRNRFTVLTDDGPLIVHNCGFLGGVGSFETFGRVYGISITTQEARRAVDGWRRANPWAMQHGQHLEGAYLRAMRNKNHEFSAGRVTYMFDGQMLWYSLPSGRVLCYPNAKFDEEGNVTYTKAAWKPAADAKEWPRARLWRGLAVENVTQAAAHDILRYSLRQIDGVVLHVHDEIVVECLSDQAETTAALMHRVMCEPPAWAEGLPLAAEGVTTTRYS